MFGVGTMVPAVWDHRLDHGLFGGYLGPAVWTMGGSVTTVWDHEYWDHRPAVWDQRLGP